MLTLYQFPISHYCEKIRWALAHKNIDYRIKNLLPGLHIKTTTALAPRSSVPILLADKNAIHNSSDIITYLDTTFREGNLTPQHPQLQRAALAWEEYIDTQIGPQVRLVCYDILLEHRSIVINFFSQQNVWYAKPLMYLSYKKLKSTMRRLMKINPQSVKVAKQQLHEALDKLNAHYENNFYLVDDQLSRADISAAALVAPLCMPERYGLKWPKKIPKEFAELMKEYSDKTQWVYRLYDRHR